MLARRVVTGVDAEGKSAVTFDGPSPGHFDLATTEFDVMWITDSAPPRLRASLDPANVSRYEMKPPVGGIKWIVMRIPPQSESDAVDKSTSKYAELMSKFDAGGVFEPDGDGWHVTQTLDLITVMSGEVDLELDDGVTHLKAGDCIVQRGVRHRWVNRSDEPCMISGIVISAV